MNFNSIFSKIIFFSLLTFFSLLHAEGDFWLTQKESLDRMIKKFNYYANGVLSLPSYLTNTYQSESEFSSVNEFERIDPVFQENNGLENKNFNDSDILKDQGKWVIQTHVQDVPVKHLIEFMMQAVGENVRFETDLNEMIDLDQENENWLQSLYGVLGAFNLQMEQIKGLESYYRIYDFANENKRIQALINQYKERSDLLKKIRKVEQLEAYYRQPSQIHLFSLKYQRVTHLLPKITKLLSKKYGEIAPLLSQEGESEILFLGSPNQLKVTGSLIEGLDKKKKQVFLEIFIVNVGDEFTKALAARLQMSKPASNSTVDNDLALESKTDLALIAQTIVSGKFSILNFLGSGRLGLELDTLEKDGLSHTLSNPKMILVDGTKGKIVQGLQFVVEAEKKTSSNGDVTVSKIFKDANLNVETEVRIVPGDQSIELNIALNNDAPNLNSNPITINKFQILSSIIVPNKGTVVIGGVLSQAMKDETSGIPILKDLPLIGALFGGKAKKDKLNELMIFISPSIIN